MKSVYHFKSASQPASQSAISEQPSEMRQVLVLSLSGNREETFTFLPRSPLHLHLHLQVRSFVRRCIISIQLLASSYLFVEDAAKINSI